MEKQKLSIVFVIRNRDLLRVKRCFESLQNQTVANFKIYLVDYGSDSKLSMDLNHYCKTIPNTNYLYINSIGQFWNKCLGYNYAIRNFVNTEYCATSDIDMFFQPNFVEEIMKLADANSVVYGHCYFLPEKFANFDKLASGYKESAWSTSIEGGHPGGFQITKTEYFHKIRGFDQFYKTWGAEDNDIHKRFKLLGLKDKWMNQSVATMYHQWHPVINQYNDLVSIAGHYQITYKYFEQNNSIERNNNEWGVTPKRILDTNNIQKYFEKSVQFNFPLKIYQIDFFQQLSFEYNKLKSGEIVAFHFYNTKKNVSFAKRISNSFVYRFGVSFKTTPDELHCRITNYVQAKDCISWLIINLINKTEITDYYLDFNDEKLFAVLIK